MQVHGGQQSNAIVRVHGGQQSNDIVRVHGGQQSNDIVRVYGGEQSSDAPADVHGRTARVPRGAIACWRVANGEMHHTTRNVNDCAIQPLHVLAVSLDRGTGYGAPLDSVLDEPRCNSTEMGKRDATRTVERSFLCCIACAVPAAAHAPRASTHREKLDTTWISAGQ